MEDKEVFDVLDHQGVVIRTMEVLCLMVESGWVAAADGAFSASLAMAVLQRSVAGDAVGCIRALDKLHGEMSGVEWPVLVDVRGAMWSNLVQFHDGQHVETGNRYEDDSSCKSA